MKMKSVAMMLVSVVLVGSLAGCSNMSKRDRNTAIGAALGGVGGSVLTGGSTLGTLGGAAGGAIIGHEVKH